MTQAAPRKPSRRKAVAPAEAAVVAEPRRGGRRAAPTTAEAGRSGAAEARAGAKNGAKPDARRAGKVNGKANDKAHAHAGGKDAIDVGAGTPRRRAAAPSPATAAGSSRGRRIVVGRSGVHGKGVFAARPIRCGETIIEYRGEVISWPEALRRHPHDPDDPTHTFYFHIDDDNVIDGKVHGNAARWINHACDPNCEADEVDGRVFIKALRDLEPGEELFYDYRLVIDERYTAKLKKQYECRCGTAGCRGTMLAPKR